MELTIQGCNTHYIDQGQGERAVLFLHGWGAPVSTYAAIFDKLSPKYRVLAFDMPGVGGTDEPRSPMTVDDYARFTLEFCQKVGLDQAILMCHSHGGRVATRLLGDPACPLRCPKAVYIDAAGVAPKRSAGYKLRLMGFKLLKRLGTAKLTKPIFFTLYEDMRDRRSSTDYKNASDVMKRTLSNVVNADMTPWMPQIKVPVLLIWGESDTATPLQYGQVMEKLIPGAGLAVVRGAGHFPFLDNWPQFSAILDAFL